MPNFYLALHFTHSDPFPVAEAYSSNFLSDWELISKLNKPVIAAVSGYAVRVHVPWIIAR